MSLKNDLLSFFNPRIQKMACFDDGLTFLNFFQCRKQFRHGNFCKEAETAQIDTEHRNILAESELARSEKSTITAQNNEHVAPVLKLFTVGRFGSCDRRRIFQPEHA